MSLDAIIIGGGHNGLVCASYLAQAGKKVRILERADVVGGAAITEEFHPGFRNSVASYTVSLLNPKIIRDLDLHRHGLKVVERRVNNLWPNEEGDFISFPAGSEALKAEIARYSQADADALARYSRDTGMVADLIRDYLLETPPNAGGGLRDLFKMAGFANRLRKLSLEDERIVMDIFTKSVADFLALYFENDYVKGAFAFDGLVGNYADTRTPGSAYVLMHHAFGEVNGKKGIWGHAIGGMGAITQAMAAAAEERGVEITLNSTVEEVLVENGKAVHIMGLLSPGGVHSHEDHIHAMARLAIERGAGRVYMHAFLDGRDTPPSSGLRKAACAPNRACPLRRIQGQLTQNGEVDVIQIHHSGKASSLLIRATCISASISAICGSVRILLR